MPTDATQQDREAREAFEKHYTRAHGHLPTLWEKAWSHPEPLPDRLVGRYLIRATQEAWEAFLAGRASLPSRGEDARDADLWRTLMSLPYARRRLWHNVLDSEVTDGHDTIESALAALSAKEPKHE